MINYFDKIKAEQIRLDEIKNNREEFLLKLDLAGGGSGSSSGKKSAGAAEKAFKMQDRLDKSGITDETTLNYYSNLFKDPLATADAYDFIEDQAKNYDRVIDLKDMPSLAAIVPAKIPVKEKIDLLKEFEIVDLTNNEEFYELARKVNNMTNKSGRTAFLDINPEAIQKTDYTAREKQLDSVRKNVIRTARAGLDNDPDKIETLNALNNLSSSNAGTRDDAEAYLFSRFITPEFIASLEEENSSFYRGLSKHPDLSGYIKSSMATTSQTVVTPPVSTTRVVTQQMANKDRRLRPFVGKEMQFELKDDGQYYPILGD
jgi:hypothetical protein